MKFEFTPATFNKLLITIVLFSLFRSCFNDSNQNRKLTSIEHKIDSLATKKDLKIEGLKTENRLIQSTDRKILDVQRQAQIDKELKELEK